MIIDLISKTWLSIDFCVRESLSSSSPSSGSVVTSTCICTEFKNEFFNLEDGLK